MLPDVKRENLRAGAIALAGVMLFSAKSVFAKLVYAYGVNPVSVIYLRMLFALPLVATIGLIYEWKHKNDKVYRKDVLQVIAISLLGYYISSLFDFIGLVYVEAAIERLILFLYPTMVIVLSIIFITFIRTFLKTTLQYYCILSKSRYIITNIKNKSSISS